MRGLQHAEIRRNDPLRSHRLAGDPVDRRRSARSARSPASGQASCHLRDQRADAPVRRRPGDRRRRDARGDARPDRAPGRDRQGGHRRGQADAAGRDLLDRLDDQADHGHGRPHAPGRGQALGRRSGREVPAGVQGPQDRGRQAGAGHDPPPAHAHLGHGRDHAPTRPAASRTWPGVIPLYVAKPVAVRAGHEVGLLPVGDQHRRPDRRGRLGRAVRRVRSSGGCSARWG